MLYFIFIYLFIYLFFFFFLFPFRLKSIFFPSYANNYVSLRIISVPLVFFKKIIS